GGAGAGHRHYRNAAPVRLAHQLEAGIGNERRSRITDQGKVTARRYPIKQLACLTALIEVMAGAQGCGNAIVLEQPAAVARVLGCDERDAAQDIESPLRDVAQV